VLRRDKELTDLMYATGVYTDERHRSYVANWNHPGTNHRCEYLFGKDRIRRHNEIRERANGFCQGCEHAHYLGLEGEWHHIKGGLGRQRCDCRENGLYVCTKFHRKHHLHVKWTKARAKWDTQT
jgi:hypothetical protein